jgi:hypothetical protein
MEQDNPLRKETQVHEVVIATFEAGQQRIAAGWSPLSAIEEALEKHNLITQVIVMALAATMQCQNYDHHDADETPAVAIVLHNNRCITDPLWFSRAIVWVRRH